MPGTGVYAITQPKTRKIPNCFSNQNRNPTRLEWKTHFARQSIKAPQNREY